MSISEMIGVFGFCLALGHISWQIWFQHRQNKERVRSSVFLEEFPCVKVVNIGVIPVYVAGVDLFVGDRKLPFEIVVRRRALPKSAGELGKEQWQRVGRPSYEEPLQRGAEQIFMLVCGAIPTKAELEKCAPRIVVRSNMGAIFRIKGKRVLEYLNALSSSKTEPVKSFIDLPGSFSGGGTYGDT